ncbi:MAG TPA: AsmA-like C-terminal region-containing protein [Gemmataceae bacterium]|nr:AsmA-like C-terminal region-containing protein [Gemmataceae bacterium]
MKRLRHVLLVSVVIFIIIGFSLRKYLTSQRLAAQVASRLEAAFGGAVRIAEIDVGLGGSTLNGLQLFDSRAADPQEPWVTVDRVKADVSLLSLLGGSSTPQNITLLDAAVTLRFDKDGRLVTTLPSPSSETGKDASLPNVRMERGRITLKKEGAADLVITGVGASLQTVGEEVMLSGDITNADNPGWGQWSLNGTLGRQSKEASVTLTSDVPLHITPAMLQQAPFMSSNVWQAVQVEGDTPVAIAIRGDWGRQTLHYHLEMEPRTAAVHVAAIDLDATAATGKVIIDDGLVTLRGVQGQAFGGTIRTDADLDFRKAPTRLDFSKVEVQGLNMRRLPASWDLPRQIDGRLRGSAHLEVVLGKGKPETRGEGEGEIVDARVGGQPTSEPVRLELHARDGGFGFRRPEASHKQNPDQEAILDELVFWNLFLVQEVPSAERILAARVVNESVRALEGAIQQVTCTGAQLVEWLADKMTAMESKLKAPERYVEVRLAMKDVDLGLLVKGLGLKFPFVLAGRVSYEVQASIPLDTPTDFRTYRVTGSTQVNSLRLGDMEFDELRGKVDYANGVLDLRDVNGRLGQADAGQTGPGGTFQGSARLGVVPLGELTATMKLEQIPLSRVAALAGAAAHVDGDFSGTVTLRAPAARLQAVEAWEASARISAQHFHVFGWAGQDCEADMRLKQGVLSLADLRMQSEGAALTGSAELRLRKPYRYGAKIALRDFELSALPRLAPAVRPAVPIGGRFSTTLDMQGTLQPLTLTTAGTGTATGLKIYEVHFKSLAFDWSSDRDRLTLTRLHAGFDQGAVDGQAVLPLQPAAGGSVDLRFTQLDLGALTKGLPAMPFGVVGQAGGTLKGTLSPAALGKERAVAVELDLQGRHLRLQGIPTEQLQGALGYHEGSVDYRFTGKALGGRFDLNGEMPPVNAAAPKPGKEGRLRIERARLSNVNEILHLRREVFPLRGLVDLEVKFRHEGPDRAPVGSGYVVVSRPRWGDVEFAESVRGDVLLTRQALRFRDITASVGGGVVHSQLALNLHRLERSWFTLSLDGVEAASIFAFAPNLAGKVEGPLEAHLRGRLGSEWAGSADIFLGRGKILGIEIMDWRIPLTWNFAPGENQGRIAVRETSARLASGRANGRATLTWGAGAHLDGQLRFFNVDVGSLLRQVADSSAFGSGRASGHFDFAGADLHSVNSLSGSLEATLTQTQAFQLPVLRQVAPFLGIQTTSTFDNGELRARLAGGMFRIEKLNLQRPPLQIAIDGNVALMGQLDLEVTAKTGLSSLGNRPGVGGAIPLLHLRVTGATHNPSIRIEPLSLVPR